MSQVDVRSARCDTSRRVRQLFACVGGGACRSDTSTPRFDAVSTRRAATSWGTTRGFDVSARRVVDTSTTCRNVVWTRPSCSVRPHKFARADSGSPHPTRRVGRRARHARHIDTLAFEWIGLCLGRSARCWRADASCSLCSSWLTGTRRCACTQQQQQRAAARQGAPRRHDVRQKREGRGAAAGAEMENRAERWWKGEGVTLRHRVQLAPHGVGARLTTNLARRCASSSMDGHATLPRTVRKGGAAFRKSRGGSGRYAPRRWLLDSFLIGSPVGFPRRLRTRTGGCSDRAE